jgi:hypothetical protein
MRGSASSFFKEVVKPLMAKRDAHAPVKVTMYRYALIMRSRYLLFLRMIRKSPRTAA